MPTLARRHLIGLGATLAVSRTVFAATGPLLALWKHRGCACCTAWARLFQEAGFVVTMHEVDDLGPARAAVARHGPARSNARFHPCLRPD